MCSFSRPQPRSMPSKRSRSKIRKPKYISLRRQLSLPSPPPPPPPPPPTTSTMSPPPTIDHDRDPPVTSLLDPGDGPSLTSLLGVSSSVAASEATSSTPSSSSLNWDGEIAIARRALRGRERWVFCCSASSPPSEQEASSSSHVDLWCAVPQALSLKLDYDEILSAWSDKGSLFIEADAGHQVVPELYHTLSCAAAAAASAPCTTVFVEVGGGGGGAWRVPEVGDEKPQSMVRPAKKEEEEDEEEFPKMKEAKLGSREERVRRYKEKRQNRLFSKRIRYEVRKLNAEKRPRMKGRFVKRKDDDV